MAQLDGVIAVMSEVRGLLASSHDLAMVIMGKSRGGPG
jgi:hypothetical protein